MSVLIGLILVGCSTSSLQATQVPTSTRWIEKTLPTATVLPVTLTPVVSTLTPTETITPIATNQVLATDAGIPLSPLRKNQLVNQPAYQITSSDTPGWNQVTNLEYGLTFRYPANLQLSTSGNFIWVSWGEQDLLIGFSRPADEVNFQWMSNSYIYIDGKRGARGNMKFMGTEIPKSVLVFAGVDWTVLYNDGNEFEVKKMAGGQQVGRVIFNAILESTVDPYNPPGGYQGISPEIQSLAEQIIGTLSFQTYTFSGWQQYIDTEFGISLDYPKEWEAVTTIVAIRNKFPNTIWKREQFTGPGGEILLDIWDAHGYGLVEWMNWWHSYTGAAREGFEPEQPNATIFNKPAIMFIQPGGQAYEMLVLFFSDGKYVYRLQYSMEDRQIGLQVFFRMVNTLKSDLLGASGPVLPVMDIE